MQVPWWTGKGYGISSITDVSGRPLLTYQGPNDKAPFLLSDRVAQKFDFTVRQELQPGAMSNGRIDSGTANTLKSILGGGPDDELDHKISLELGGANTPANLWIQQGRTSGASFSSDQLENTLALDTVAGRISLLEAWRTLEDQKGFLLAEDFVGPDKKTVLSALAVLGGTVKDLITGKLIKGTVANDPQIKIAVDKLLSDLSKDRFNQVKKRQLLKLQVDANAAKLQVSPEQAGSATKSALSAYTESKGISATELLSGLDPASQRLVSVSKNTPQTFGIDNTTMEKILTNIAPITGGVALLGTVIAVIGVLLAGPEIVSGLSIGAGLGSLLALLPFAPVIATGLLIDSVAALAFVTQFLLSAGLKGQYDQGLLATTQEIQAFKNILDLKKQLAGFLPSSQKVTGDGTIAGKNLGETKGSTTQLPEKTAATGQPSASNLGVSAKTKVFTGIISQGTLISHTEFTPAQSSLITNENDLTNIAHENLVKFLAVLPGELIYTIKLANSYQKDDGTWVFATSQKIIDHYSKATGPIKVTDPTTFQTTVTGYKNPPKAHYKTITNKFAILDIEIYLGRYKQIKIASINLGPVDQTNFKPTNTDLNMINENIQKNVATTDTGHFNAVVSPTPTAILNVAPPTIPEPTIEHKAVAVSIGMTPEELVAAGIKVSTTFAEAQQNLIPVKLVYNGGGKVGFPAQLLATNDPNVPFGYTEVTLQHAQDIINASPSNYIVTGTDKVNQLYTQLGINNATQDDFYSKVLVVGTIGSIKITPQQILAGNLPGSNRVWILKDKNGNLLTNVPLEQVPDLLK